MNTTISSGVMPANLSTSASPYGASRGIFSDFYNANKVAAEDWLRSEQSADLALQRDMERFKAESEFNASESQKQRDFEEYMASTAYQRTIKDLKTAGYNPVLAFQQGAASSGSGSAASASVGSSGSSSSSPGTSDSFSQVLLSLVSAISGLVGFIPTKNYKFGF